MERTSSPDEVVVFLTWKEASAIEALLACIDREDHPELAAATSGPWFVLQTFREGHEDRWDFNFTELAEKALQRVSHCIVVGED